MSSVLVKTVGCRLNQAESTELGDAFAARGADLVSDRADLVVVNTCTVTAESSRTSRRLIRRAVRENPGAEVIVTGCYAVAAPDEVAEIEGVSQVVPNKDKDAIVGKVLGSKLVEPSPVTGQSAVRRTLKVQTGCDEGCTYCIVPTTRGAPESRPAGEVAAAAMQMVAAGARELTLSGVHLGRYGADCETDLVSLVKTLLHELPADVSLRLSSIELTCVSDALLGMIVTEERICRHLHIPLQSGDDGILGAMGRPYSAGEFVETVLQATLAVEGLALTTDVMVGFPGETDRAFSNTLDVVERSGFMKLHVFRYSPRIGTSAATRTDKIASEVQRERSGEVRRLGDRLRLRFHERNALEPGKVIALVEAAGRAHPNEPGRPALYCVTDNYMKAVTSGPAGYVGKFVELSVTGVTAESIQAAPLGDQALRGSGRPG